MSIIREKIALLSLYPAIVVLGSMASFTAHDSFFADKRNFINQWFVKRGWLWFTLCYVAAVFRQKKPHWKHIVLRYVVATLWWVIFAQWLFGAPLMDRIFVWTGGQCSGDTVVTTSRACRLTGGTWSGGHDPSGHIFIIVHSSLVLLMELWPGIKADRSLSNTSIGERISLSLLVLWGWMLLMTSVYFHSIPEKLSGLFLGLLEVAVVYLGGEYHSWGLYFGVGEPEESETKIPTQ